MESQRYVIAALAIGGVLFGSVAYASAESIQATFERARELAVGGQLEESVTAFRDGLRGSPTSAEVAYSLAVVLEKRGDVNAAIAAYRESIRLQADNPGAHFYLGVLLDKHGDKQSAASSLQEAIDRGMDDMGAPYASYWLSAIWEDLGDREKAFRAYRDVYSDAHRFRLGCISSSDSEVDLRIQKFREALDLCLNRVEAVTRVGLMLVRVGLPERVELEIQTSLGDQRDLEAAISHLRTAMTLAPGDPGLHMMAALLLGHEGNCKDALSEAQEAVRLSPGSPQSHWILAYRYLDLDRHNEAAAELREYMRLEQAGPRTNSGIERAKILLQEMAPYLSH